MEITKKSLKDSVKDLLVNWNKTISHPFQLTERLIQEKLVDSVFTLVEGSYSLYSGNDYLGSIVLKHQNNFSLENPPLFISLIFIVPQYQNRGYGTLLLENSKKIAFELGYSKLIVGGDLDCLFSGVFVQDNQIVHDFFKRNAWSVLSRNFNLITDKQKDCNIKIPKQYQLVTNLSKSDYEHLLDFIEKHFSPRWLYETRQTDPKYIFALKDGEIVIGFIRWGDSSSRIIPNSVNQYSSYSKLAGIGPLGIDPDYRHQGLGVAFVSNALQELWHLGYHQIIVDWTNLVTFYQKCGFSHISSEFIQYQYSLRG